jgi:hypothetical protein
MGLSDLNSANTAAALKAAIQHDIVMMILPLVLAALLYWVWRGFVEAN